MDLVIRPIDPTACWGWKGATHRMGYGSIKITDRPRTKREQLAHRMMWIAVNGPIPDGLLVLHRCDNPPCCNPKHLFLGTKADNSHDAMTKGRQVTGERHGKAKLNDEAVRHIRVSKMTARELARLYHVSDVAIWYARTGKTWRHTK